MRDIFTKLRILWSLWSADYQMWRDEIWRHQLDDTYCCSGNCGPPDFCGCQGATIRDIYDYREPAK